jgi:hypothetical protein
MGEVMTAQIEQIVRKNGSFALKKSGIIPAAKMKMAIKIFFSGLDFGF